MNIRLKSDHSQTAIGVFRAYSDHLIIRWEETLGNGSYLSYLSTHWEPVPEETWVDVTEELQHYETIHYRTHFHRKIDVLTMAEGYRLREVTMNDHETDTPCRKAFIVEKKVSSQE